VWPRNITSEKVKKGPLGKKHQNLKKQWVDTSKTPFIMLANIMFQNIMFQNIMFQNIMFQNIIKTNIIKKSIMFANREDKLAVLKKKI